MTELRFNPPLSADDPRISEWLDGRLPEAEAVEIARLVAASPELTRMVADLRRQKAALAALPASPPPARFVADVLAVLDAAGDMADDDAEVEGEWRRIERERLAEEIAEARDDAAEPVDEPMRHRWPWLALAGALAAGVLAAVVINRPGGMADREVALVAPQQREQSETKRAAAEARQGDEAAAQDTWLPDGDADGDAAADKVTGSAAAAPENLAAERQTLERGRAPMEKLDGAPEFAGEDGEQALAKKSRMAPPAAPSTRAAAQAQGAQGAGGGTQGARGGTQGAGGGIGGGGSGKEPHVRSVTYRIRTAADRQRLESLLAASGRMTMDRANRKLQNNAKDENANGAESLRRKAATDGVAKALEARDAARRRGGPGGPPSERIAISGPADVMARLAAALEASPATEAKAGADGDTDQAKYGLPAKPAAPPAGDAQTEITLVIVVVDESGAAVEAEEGQP